MAVVFCAAIVVRVRQGWWGTKTPAAADHHTDFVGAQEAIVNTTGRSNHLVFSQYSDEPGRVEAVTVNTEQCIPIEV